MPEYLPGGIPALIRSYFNVSDLFSLWPHQDNAVVKIETAWRDGIRSVCWQSPTGSGKTRVVRQIVDNHSLSKKIIYVIAHRKNLVRQLSDELTEADIGHGLIQSGKPYIRYRVQVCSVQTLVNRLGSLPEPEILIFDEFHHAVANTFLKIIRHWPGANILGVTATPARRDGKPLSDVADILIPGEPVRDLIDNGYLSDYEYYAPEIIDMTGVHTSKGDYIQREAEERVDKKQIIGSVIGHYKKYADHKPAIVCCVSIAHAEHVAEFFRTAGYRARAVHSKLDDDYIQESIDGLRNGTVEILTQCELLGEGVDIKGAAVLIDVRPTESLTVYLQHAGRVLRYVEGKTAIILDHVGNWARHGLPDDPREWSLEGKVTQSETSALKRCPECMRPVKKEARVCPHCGYEFAGEAREPVIPEEQDGQLVNIREIPRIEKNDLIIKIARNAWTLRQAILIAKKHGVDHRGAYYIWVKILKKSVDNKDKQ